LIPTIFDDQTAGAPLRFISGAKTAHIRVGNYVRITAKALADVRTKP